MWKYLLPFILLALTALTPAQKELLLYDDCDFSRYPGVTAWLDSSIPSKLTVGSVRDVSAWSSRVGSVSFAQSTSANRPILTLPGNQENRVLYSEDLTKAGTAQWTPTRAVVLSTTEFREDSTASNTHYISSAGTGGRLNVVAGNSYSLSFLAKRGTATQRNLVAEINWDNASTVNLAYISLETCAVTSTTGSSAAWISTDGAAEGAYCRFTGVASSSTVSATASYLRFYLSDASAGDTRTYNGDGSSSLILTQVAFRSFLADPIYIATTDHPLFRGITGRSALRFDGAASYMTSATTLGGVFANGAKANLIVFRPYTLNKEGFLLADAAGARWSVIVDASGSRARLFNGGTGTELVYGGLTNNVPQLLNVRHDVAANVLSLAINNSTLAKLAATTTNTGAMTGTLSLGRFSSGSYLAADVSEIVLANQAWSPYWQNRAKRCLCKKWGANC